jgi:hypothetical protein
VVLTAHGNRFRTCCEFSCFLVAGSKYLTFVHLPELSELSRSKTALTLADLYNSDQRSGAFGKLVGITESISGFPQCWTSRAAASSTGVGEGAGFAVCVLPLIAAQ